MLKKLLGSRSVLVVAAVSSAASIGTMGLISPEPARAAVDSSAASRGTPDPLSDAFAEAAARVKSSVVYVIAKQEQPNRSDGRQRDLPPDFRKFFDLPGLPDAADPRRREGTGSGFIVSKDGHILTNAHVVDGASKVTVRLLDRREFEAEVIGADAATDVAVLKVDADDLTPVRFADSDASRVGEWVLAVGNPLGERLTFTVTSGIISAKGRSLNLPGSSAQTIQDFIQTDAAINPGNSGGPLVNARGEVIGINSAIASPTGSYAGYGFAVPSNLARRVMAQLIEHGEVRRSALGISVRDAGPTDAEYVGLSGARGVLVQDFENDKSPAKQAGLLAGDVILGVDGHKTDYVGQLQERVAFRKPGDTVRLEVARKGGARVMISVRLAEAKAPAPQRRTSDLAEPETEGTEIEPLGVWVNPVSDAAARRMGLPKDALGLEVLGIDDEGPAGGRLFADGTHDIITAVEGRPVRTLTELRAALDRVGEGRIATLIVYDVSSGTRRIERIKLAE